MATLPLFEIITLGATAMYIEGLQSNREPLLGEALFPARKKLGLNLEWLKGYDDLPVMLQPSAFDAKPLLRDRRGIQKENVTMPFFREAARFGEEDRQKLLVFMEATRGMPYADEIIQRFYNDTAGLVEGAMLVPEVMRMGLLVDGQFAIASPDDSGQYVNYTYNYDPNNTWKNRNTVTLTGTDMWSDHANSHPVQDIIALKRSARTRGLSLTRAIMGYDTWLDLISNASVKPDITSPLTRDIILTDEDYMQYYERKTGIQFTVYDKEYCPPGTSMFDNSAAAEFFYPQRGNITFMGAAIPGYTNYGTTPEEADLMAGNTDAEVSIINTGVAVAMKKESLPVNIINWVSQIVLPSYENMNTVFNIKYTA